MAGWSKGGSDSGLGTDGWWWRLVQAVAVATGDGKVSAVNDPGSAVARVWAAEKQG